MVCTDWMILGSIRIFGLSQEDVGKKIVVIQLTQVHLVDAR